MNKKLIHLFIFVLLVFFTKEALAGTDVLCNVLTTINTVLKEVGEVQNKISGKVREITSMKISPESILNLMGADKLMSDAENLKEKAENLKEKAERLKEFAENAKEEKAELMAKYQELNALVTEEFAKANEAYTKAKAIYEEYEGKYQQIKSDIQNGMVMAQDTINAVKTAPDAVKNLQEVGMSAIDPQVSNLSELKNMSASIKATQSEMQMTPINNTEIKTTKLEAVETIGAKANIQADTISSASRLVHQTIKENQTAIETPIYEILEENKVNISAKDIMKGASELKQKPDTNEEVLKTNIDLKNQLVDSVNKPLNISDDEKAVKSVFSEKAKSIEVNASKPKKVSIDELNNNQNIKNSVLLNKTVIKEIVNAKQ